MPWLLIVVAGIGAFIFSQSDTEIVQRWAAGTFGFALGAALLLWGVEEQNRGTIRVKRIQLRKTEFPKLFLATLVISRFLPGVFMLGVALWYVFVSRPT